MEDSLERKWLLSEEYKIIRQFSELYIASMDQLMYSDEQKARIVDAKLKATEPIKKAWLERNQNGS